ncbi:hypothetical protein FPZ11_05605 [Humibacter ginsenosidimutans]|uniref:Uncharacterized protein n=1 Tax=Humibacter ginsenosidimutans TaxID=2599293 RepID=A0A5B8M3L4_9MICO|nr:hypothetical protein FPZ11_05605 [Humibacter ginsenosidimutans]
MRRPVGGVVVGVAGGDVVGARGVGVGAGALVGGDVDVIAGGGAGGATVGPLPHDAAPAAVAGRYNECTQSGEHHCNVYCQLQQ